MHNAKLRIKELSRDFNKVKRSLKIPGKKSELKMLEAKATAPDFWNDQAGARGVMQKIGDLKKDVDTVGKIEKTISDLSELSSEKGLAKEIGREVAVVAKQIKKLEITTYLSGEYDNKNAIVSVHSGQGGVEAMDWAAMLFRMYLRYFEKKDWKADVLEETPGEEAGIKTVTFRVQAPYAYGYLKGEAGAHRLVRQSPFNADKLRQTSFALVEVLPEFEEVDLPDIEINDDDLEWQFFRASGQGGQNVQKVSSAVRLIHKPTGIAVTAQTERHQEQNRKYAMNLLRAKLWALEQERAKKEKEKVAGEYKPATWGTQIRSYVLHPYKMVKDLRTNVETSDAEGVLDGDLDIFVEAELRL